MLFRIICLIPFTCLTVIIIGCGALFSVQEWSENYALMDGTQSTTPQAIDGNLNTIGDAVFPGDVTGMSPASEVVITLPEKKKIRRIVVYSENVVEFDVFVAKESHTTERNWTLIKEIKNASNSATVAVLTPYPTDRVRLRIRRTRDDASKSREFGAKYVGYIRASNRRAVGKIREIELYGYKTTSEQVEVDKTEDKREQDLDDLLNLE